MKYLIALILLCCSLKADFQREVLASVIISEAGGEGRVGMQAVACVIANRCALNKTPLQVVLAPKQFSCLNGVSKKDFARYIARRKKHLNWSYAYELANKIISKNLVDITKGATHYHTVQIKPYWSKKLAFTTRIGNHKFYRS